MFCENRVEILNLNLSQFICHSRSAVVEDLQSNWEIECGLADPRLGCCAHGFGFMVRSLVPRVGVYGQSLGFGDAPGLAILVGHSKGLKKCLDFNSSYKMYGLGE